MIAALNGDASIDRLPVIEWASWWNLTLDRWHGEGLDPALRGDALFEALKLDVQNQFWFKELSSACPKHDQKRGRGVHDLKSYEALKPLMYQLSENEKYFEQLRALKPQHDAGLTSVWYTFSGGFWFPRELFGVEEHLYSFYDEPELYRTMLDDLAEFQLKLLERIYKITTPEFMTFAEDMSYNKGPMLSERMFDEFLLPYYNKLIPFIHAHGTKVIVDSDGDITEMIPWLRRAGFDGALPLEYQAGVDIVKIREKYPDFILIGGYNKRIMKDGEAAMRKEFERILPVIKSGRCIPSCDHQTPPDVSLENYRTYVRLLTEYCSKVSTR